MRLCSLDIFDTVLTRRFAEPVDLFLLCGEILQAREIPSVENPTTFATQRMRAEASARRAAPGSEPTFEEIYLQLGNTLGWDAGIRTRAMRVELEAESEALVTFPEAQAMADRAREAADQLLYLSDMYLPEDFIRKVLYREGLLHRSDKIYVSNQHRASKTEGTLFDLVRKDFPEIDTWKHLGDRPHSDFTMPRRSGIDASLFSEANLSSWERKIRGNAIVAPRLQSTLAGTMRVARLRRPQAISKPIWELGTNIAGPLLVAFTHWVLRSAEQKNIDRLYFVARDGEILLRIARILCQNWKIPVDCRYLHGSRQAWHAAGITQLGQFEKQWLFEADAVLTLSTIADRLGIPVEHLRQQAAKAGDSAISISTPLSPPQIDLLWTCLRSEPLASIVLREAAINRQKVVSYLSQEGFFENRISAIVDIGWRGNMQKSLGSLISAAGLQWEPRGFYFGLVAPLPEKSYHSFWQNGTGGQFPQERARLMEIFTAGREGSTFAYEEVNGAYRPTMKKPLNDEAIQWGLEEFQEGVLAFASTFSQSARPNDSDSTVIDRTVCNLFLNFCSAPSRELAARLGSFPHAADQLETQFLRMIDGTLPRFQFAKLAWNRTLWNAHPWVEGQLAIQPCWPVWASAQLRKWKRRIPSFRR